MTCQINTVEGYCSDYPSIFKGSHVKAAMKDHRCSECGRIIAKGESYQNESGVWDGKFSTYKTCKDCLSLRDAFFCSWSYGELWNDFRGEIYNSDGGEHLADRLDELTPAARDRACSIFDRCYEDMEK